MKLKPVGPCVLVKIIPDEVEALTSKLINLPESVTRLNDLNATRCEVVELSPHAFKEWFQGEHWVKVGDIAYVKMHSGIQKEIDGEMYRVVEDKDFWCIVEP